MTQILSERAQWDKLRTCKWSAMSKMCSTHVNINVICRKRLRVRIYSDAMNDCELVLFVSGKFPQKCAVCRRVNNNQTDRTAPMVMFGFNRWDVMWAPLFFFFLQHASHLRWSVNGKRRDEAGVRLTASWAQFHAASRFRGCRCRECCCSLSVIHPSMSHSSIHPFTNSSVSLASIHPSIDQLIITIHLITHHLSITVSAIYSSIHYSSISLWIDHPATHPSITQSSIHPFINSSSFIHPSIYPFIDPLIIHPPIHLITHHLSVSVSSNHASIHSVHSFIHLFIHQSTRHPSFVHPVSSNLTSSNLAMY